MPAENIKLFKEGLRDSKNYAVKFDGDQFECDEDQLQILPTLDLFFTDEVGEQITVKLPW